ncbi:GAF domain-containing sensor histidine kinase [Flavobacterium commune]|uniref:histidine kinase n=1 Tax=Flavobacterium commune TaxID=1306519 RepID=A0A1D9P9X1_9FLAO|nr:GAF domain-containing sensor histidine kinase [Flavobacterium commune]AOZ99390.1 histidine kinase [Flavobacterium commune]
MIKPDTFVWENERLKDLDSYAIIDTLPEDEYDELTYLASQICGTPISLISLLDNKRQWFKSHYGTDVMETSKEIAFCAHAILNPDEVFIVQDARNDHRFYDNPLVIEEPNVVFYAGAPLVSQNGLPLGTLCVIDNKPNELSENQIKSLKALSNQAMKLLELRKKKKQLEKNLFEFENKNKELERFAYIAAHDLKSPLGNINALTDFFIEHYCEDLEEEASEIIALIHQSSAKLRGLIDELLEYSKYDKIIEQEKAEIDLQILKKEILGLFSFNNKYDISLKSNVSKLIINKVALEQILINLISNAIKYNDKEIAQIEIMVNEEDLQYRISVTDNGPGISKENQHKIFEIFEVLDTCDHNGETGNGIGLATVKKLVLALGGTIDVESEVGKFTRFNFTIEKF